MNHFWLRVADVCIFPNIYIFWVILSIIEAAFLKKKKKELHYCLWQFLPGHKPIQQVFKAGTFLILPEVFKEYVQTTTRTNIPLNGPRIVN